MNTGKLSGVYSHLRRSPVLELTVSVLIDWLPNKDTNTFTDQTLSSRVVLTMLNEE